MEQWDGRGLPPVAQRRMERFADHGVRTSLLCAPAAVALADVGFEPVGETMGSIVEQIGFSGAAGCNWGLTGGNRLSTVTSTRSSPFAAYRPYVSAMNRGYQVSMQRMLQEARAMGADGVVGVRISTEHLSEHVREFVMLGTAVRARSRTRPDAVFTTELGGTEVAALLHSGWVPVGIVVGLEVALRHDDWTTTAQGSWGAGNTEVSGFTELAQHTRGLARQRFAEGIARTGAEGAVVSDLRMRMWEYEPSDGHRDHAAEATVVGTAVARFAPKRTAPNRVLSMLPLSPGARS